MREARRRGGRGAWGRWTPAAVLACVAGCCVTPPPAAKFFHRRSPEETLKGFVYAVDAHQWDYAHECLTEESRREVGAWKLQAALLYYNVDVPFAGGSVKVPLYDLVSNSLKRLKDDAAIEMGPGAKRLEITTRARDSEGGLNYFPVTLYFLLEDGAWRLDLLGSMSTLAGVRFRPVPLAAR